MRHHRTFILLLMGALLAFGASHRVLAQVAVTDDLVIKDDTVLRPGTYTVDDVKSDGVIQIAADNVTLDGTGVVIQGTGFRGFGIHMNGHSGLTLRNVTIRGFTYGIWIENASNVTIEGSDVSSNLKDTQTGFLDIGCGACYGGGILFRDVTSSTVSGNTLTDQSTGLELIGGGGNEVSGNLLSEGPAGNESQQDSCWGIRLEGSTDNRVHDNTADFVDRERYGLSSGDSAGILLVAGADRNQIVHNSITHSGDGFFLGNSCARASNDNFVSRNDGSFSPHNAFEATFSSGNVFDHNKADHSDYGFWLGYSHDSRVTGNEIASNASMGIAIEHGHGNEIDHDTITQNPLGIRLWAADTTCLFADCGASCPSADYDIHDNTVTVNSIGLYLENTDGAAVTFNRLADNRSRNVVVTGESPGVVLSREDLSCHRTRRNRCQFAVVDEMPAGLNVDAANSYWGTPKAAAIPALILDSGDNRGLGKVIFVPFLKKPVSRPRGASGLNLGMPDSE
jgi:parallel beta-helix repeat protein